MADVRATYDREVDAAYIYFTEAQANPEVASTYPCDPVRVGGMINLDFDADGRIFGIEVPAASSKLPRHLLDVAERLDS